MRKPTIAKIHGVCVGGGAGIALACDFRYADPNLRFGIPIARTLGNCLSLKGYSRLGDYVGPAKAKELIMLAKLLTADEALNLGVVTEIVPSDQLETRSGEVAAPDATRSADAGRYQGIDSSYPGSAGAGPRRGGEPHPLLLHER